MRMTRLRALGCGAVWAEDVDAVEHTSIQAARASRVAAVTLEGLGMELLFNNAHPWIASTV
jgi:hypothetical protein